MALTITLAPPPLRHLGNPTKVIINSDNTEPNHAITITIGTLIRWTLYTDASQNVTFDFSKLVESQFIAWELNFPSTNSPNFVNCSQNCKEITALAIDAYTGSLETDIDIGPVVILTGGLSFEYNQLIDFWATYFIANAPAYPFLTWRNKSKKKYTTSDAIEFLSYYVYDAAYTSINAKIKAYDYTDTAISTQTIPLAAAFTAGEKHLLRFGCGMGNVDYSALFTPLTDIKYFDVWLEDDAEGVISEERRYYMDRNFYAHNHQFLYWNSLAGIDTVIMHGEINMTQEITRTNVKRYVPPVYNVTSGSKAAAFITGGNSFKVAYYPCSQYERELMQEMFLSPKVVKWENGIMKPIIITSSKVDYGNLKDEIPFMEFEYMYAFDNPFYTPAP